MDENYFIIFLTCQINMLNLLITFEKFQGKVDSEKLKSKLSLSILPLNDKVILPPNDKVILTLKIHKGGILLTKMLVQIYLLLTCLFTSIYF